MYRVRGQLSDIMNARIQPMYGGTSPLRGDQPGIVMSASSRETGLRWLVIETHSLYLLRNNDRLKSLCNTEHACRHIVSQCNNYYTYTIHTYNNYTHSTHYYYISQQQ